MNYKKIIIWIAIMLIIMADLITSRSSLKFYSFGTMFNSHEIVDGTILLSLLLELPLIFLSLVVGVGLWIIKRLNKNSLNIRSLPLLVKIFFGISAALVLLVFIYFIRISFSRYSIGHDDVIVFFAMMPIILIMIVWIVGFSIKRLIRKNES